jgi:hypothetical protein
LIIQSVVFTNGSAIVNWSAIPGLNYSLQYKDFLDGPAWHLIAPAVPAATTNAAATNMTGPAPQRFYRVLVVP